MKLISHVSLIRQQLSASASMCDTLPRSLRLIGVQLTGLWQTRTVLPPLPLTLHTYGYNHILRATMTSSYYIRWKLPTETIWVSDDI